MLGLKDILRHKTDSCEKIKPFCVNNARNGFIFLNYTEGSVLECIFALKFKK
jgi:hypothetical protein